MYYQLFTNRENKSYFFNKLYWEIYWDFKIQINKDYSFLKANIVSQFNLLNLPVNWWKCQTVLKWDKLLGYSTIIQILLKKYLQEDF